MKTKLFRKCHICGTHGHPGKCPVADLQKEQAKMEIVKAHNIRLGLTPELEEELAQMRLGWKVK